MVEIKWQMLSGLEVSQGSKERERERERERGVEWIGVF
jgi:hypothetical protein